MKIRRRCVIGNFKGYYLKTDKMGDSDMWGKEQKKKNPDRWPIWRRKQKAREDTDWWRLQLTIAWNGEVMCAKAVLDMWQWQGGMSQEVVFRAPVNTQEKRKTFYLTCTLCKPVSTLVIRSNLRYRGNWQQERCSSSIADRTTWSRLHRGPELLPRWSPKWRAQLAGQFPRRASCRVVVLRTAAIQLNTQLKTRTGFITAEGNKYSKEWDLWHFSRLVNSSQCILLEATFTLSYTHPYRNL